jgi:hypothetical protein
MSTKRRLPEASARQLDSLDRHIESALEVLEAAKEDIRTDPKECASNINYAMTLLLRALRHSDRARRNED